MRIARGIIVALFIVISEVLLIEYSYAFIAMPSGLDTMDEILEAFTLIQTRKIDQFPIVLFRRKYGSN